MQAFSRVDTKLDNRYIFVGPLQRVRSRNRILCLGLGLVVLVPLRSEFIGEL